MAWKLGSLKISCGKFLQKERKVEGDEKMLGRSE
jgi:hypothetical protein